MLKRLYIIGNGFDLHHGIPSSYRDYRKWLEENDRDLLERLREYYDVDSEEWWGEFEEALGHPNMGLYIEMTTFLERPRFYEDGTNELRDVLDGGSQAREELGDLVATIRDTFRQWVEDFPKPDTSAEIELNSDDAFFINFNYTDTLQRIYKVNRESVWYIHGEARGVEGLVLGHNRSYEELNTEYRPDEPEPPADCEDIEKWKQENDATGEDLIHWMVREEVVTQISDLNKGVEGIIFGNQAIFDRLKTVQEVYVYGLSFSPVDIPYLDEIVKQVPKETAIWTVSYYSADDLRREKKYFKDKSLSQIKYVKLEDLMRVRPGKLNFVFD